MSFLRNTWYVAAWSNEIESSKLLVRRLLNEPIILFREADGTFRALADRCPHRQAPLHMGSFDGTTIRCGYHGLGFNGAGQCVHNPQGPVPRAARVPTYPVVERDSLLWIWMGDAERADPALIPDFSFQNPEQFFVGKRYLHVRSGYRLEVENILDLSHIAFLHPTTLGGSAVASGEFVSEVDGQSVWSKRGSTGDMIPDGLADVMGLPRGEPVDRWMDVQWHAPANMVLYGGGTPTGKSRAEGRGVVQAHCFTPETDTASHYFFSITFPRAMGEFGAKLAEEQADWLKVPFETEDLPMLEAQQQNMSQFPDVPSFRLASDAAGVRALRILDSMIASERSTSGAPTG
jgi:vanillate O-demethylase monooxygenase subunit